MATISWDDFAKIELRVGRIVGAEPFPEARKPACRLLVNERGEVALCVPDQAVPLGTRLL